MMLVASAVRITVVLLPPLLMPLLVGTAPSPTIRSRRKLRSAPHGESGVPQLKTTPVIWGQNAGYLFYQLA